jgi:hypothetical protein
VAIVKLKTTPQHAVVRCSGAGTWAVTLASLASPRQTSLGTAPNGPIADIKAILFVVPTGATAKIVRNGVTLYDFPVGWGRMDFNGYADVEQHDQDVSVVITGTASVIIEFAKTTGWGDTQNVGANNEVPG